MKSVPLILLTIFLLYTIEHDSAQVTKLTNYEKPPEEYKTIPHNITGEKKVLTNSTGYTIGDLLTHTEKPSEEHKINNYNITRGGVKDLTEKPTKGQKENSHNAIEKEIYDYTNLTDYDIDDVQTFVEYYKNHSLDKKKIIQKRFLPLLGLLGTLVDVALLIPEIIPKPKTKRTTTTSTSTTISNSDEYTDSGSENDSDYDYNGTEVTSRRKATRSIKKGKNAIRDSDNSINVDYEEIV